MSDTRIHMTETVSADLGAGAVQLRGGQWYLLPDEVADRLIDRRVAYEEGEPPECDVCGAPFTGVGAFVGRDRHRGESHGAAAVDWSPGQGTPPPLDDTHRDVQRLRQRTIPDQYEDGLLAEKGLKQMAHDLGVSEDEIVPTGASGPVKDDYIRHILRAQGRKGFYERPDADEEE